MLHHRPSSFSHSKQSHLQFYILLQGARPQGTDSEGVIVTATSHRQIQPMLLARTLLGCSRNQMLTGN